MNKPKRLKSPELFSFTNFLKVVAPNNLTRNVRCDACTNFLRTVARSTAKIRVDKKFEAKKLLTRLLDYRVGKRS